VTHRWTCLIGQPVAQSLSPALHNAAFNALGIDAHYEARAVSLDDLPDAVAALRAVDCLGANVTAPHKRAVMEYLDEVSPEASALGAVNTVVNNRGRLIGSNTDAPGLAHWMRISGIDLLGQRALVIGAGGAARATVWALANLGADAIVVLNRTVERAEDLVTQLRARVRPTELMWGQLEEAAEPPRAPWPIVVNATSLGHQASAPVVHPGCYSRHSVALELVYNPPETRFMASAREAGARVENGMGMLLHQAALSFERWTGQAPPLAVYQAVIERQVVR
jgi:shikimate dehydrogenase